MPVKLEHIVELQETTSHNSVVWGQVSVNILYVKMVFSGGVCYISSLSFSLLITRHGGFHHAYIWLAEESVVLHQIKAESFSLIDVTWYMMCSLYI